MTKKHIWAKLLIVALVIAMVCVVFAGCKDDTPENVTPPPDEDSKGAEAVTELLGVVDDAVAAIGGIDNIGSLGTDAFVEVVVNDTKVRIDLDLSLDLLRATGEGAYGQNGFGFTVSVNDKQEFGLWYADMASDDNSFIYLAAGGQKLKIDGLTLAKVLARYDVNADVAVGDKLTEALKGQTITDMAGDLADTIASMLTIGYDNSNPNSKVFTLSVKELFNPEGLVATMLDGLLFDEATVGFDLKGILADAGIGLTSLSQLYTILPDVNLKVTGNYNNGVFESIGIGLDIAGKEDGIVLPGTSENPKGFVVVESVPNTTVSATLGFKILPNSTVYNTLADTVDGYLGDESWRQIGVLNFSAEAEVTLGKTKEDSNKYKVEISADINAAAVAAATFTKRVYYTDDAGNYIKKDGQPVYTDWFYLSDATNVFGESDDTDILNALLPNINNLYLKMENVDDPNDIFVIALTEKVTFGETGDIDGGKIFVKLAALNNIMSAFGLNLSDLLGDLSDTIMGLEGEVNLKTVIPAVMGILPGMIYKIPEEYAALGATKFQPVAPATATADEAATDGATDTATDSGFSLNTVIDIVKKAIACLDTSKWESDSTITAKDTGDLTIGGSKITFDMAATILKNADNAVNGAKVVFNAPLVADYQADIKDGENKIGTNKVYTSVNVPLLQIGGTGNLFKATVSVHQDKTVTYTTEDADHQNSDTDFDIYIEFDLLSIGYGCAPTEPIALEINDKTFVKRTGSLYVEGAGWSIAKADVK